MNLGLGLGELLEGGWRGWEGCWAGLGAAEWGLGERRRVMVGRAGQGRAGLSSCGNCFVSRPEIGFRMPDHAILRNSNPLLCGGPIFVGTLP